MPSHSFNETGYWEDADFHALNREILDSFGNRLRRIVPLTEKEVSILLKSHYLGQAAKLLLKKIPQDRPFAIKVPTFSLSIAFWKKVCEELGVPLGIVIGLRNPMSVALSAERCFMDAQEKSFWIWISSMLNALVYSEGNQRILVDYDELIKNPSHQIERIATLFQWKLHKELLHDYTQYFINPKLRHVMVEDHSFSNNELCFTLALKMYKKLLPVAIDQGSFEGLKKPLKKWSKKFSSVQNLLVTLETQESTIAKLINLHVAL
ncbi:MAG: hypothetical protein ACOYK6_02220 [Chthoniobacterales bacterium]